jgi:hypothetical protein
MINIIFLPIFTTLGILMFYNVLQIYSLMKRKKLE